MQDIMLDLMTQGALKIPKQYNILLKSVCPAFLKFRCQAADILKHLLTKDFCRNFSILGL